MIRTCALALLTIASCCVLGCGATKEPTSDETDVTPEAATLTTVGEPAPPIELTALDGTTFRLADHRGKVVVVNFFATWCPPCREEMPHLEKKVWQRFRDDRFAMLAVGREHANDELHEFVDQYSLTFPVAGDPDRAVYSHYATQYIPRTVVVDSNGTIVFQSSGFEHDELAAMIDVIESALTKIPDTAAAKPDAA